MVCAVTVSLTNFQTRIVFDCHYPCLYPAAPTSLCRGPFPGDAQRTHADCAELLLLLRDYLRASQQPQLADTACRMLGGVLGQQEHLLRCTRLEHWSLEAVVHMDALIQLYTQLLGQVGLCREGPSMVWQLAGGECCLALAIE